jgi:hypothetical protein
MISESLRRDIAALMGALEEAAVTPHVQLKMYCGPTEYAYWRRQGLREDQLFLLKPIPGAI